MSSSVYPRVHRTDSSAYFSYRPINRFVERAERRHITDNSSRMREFQPGEEETPLERALEKRPTLTPAEEEDAKKYKPADSASLARLRQKHPFKLPEDDVHVPPHESSIWPEERPHFHLVSSYDTMLGFLGISQKASQN